LRKLKVMGFVLPFLWEYSADTTPRVLNPDLQMQLLADYHNQQQLTRTLKLMNLRMFQVHKRLGSVDTESEVI
jgi:hypothetical protein